MKLKLGQIFYTAEGDEHYDKNDKFSFRIKIERWVVVKLKKDNHDRIHVTLCDGKRLYTVNSSKNFPELRSPHSYSLLMHNTATQAVKALKRRNPYVKRDDPLWYEEHIKSMRTVDNKIKSIAKKGLNSLGLTHVERVD